MYCKAMWWRRLY